MRLEFITHILQSLTQTNDRYPVNLNNKWGYINKRGKIVIDPEYDFAAEFHNGLGRVMRNGLYGFVNSKGKLVIDCIYEDANDFSEGLCAVLQDESYGYIDKKGQVAIPFNYHRAGMFMNGLARVSLYCKDGFVDKKGEEVIPITFGSSLDYPWGGLFRTFGREQREFYFTRKGKQIWPNNRYFSEEEISPSKKDEELPF